MKQRPPLPGYNHNVRHTGHLFHVQTEDSGLQIPRIFTHLFFGGTIVASKRSEYVPEEDERAVQERMQMQHKSMLKELRAGGFDAKISRLFAGEAVPQASSATVSTERNPAPPLTQPMASPAKSQRVQVAPPVSTTPITRPSSPPPAIPEPARTRAPAQRQVIPTVVAPVPPQVIPAAASTEAVSSGRVTTPEAQPAGSRIQPVQPAAPAPPAQAPPRRPPSAVPAASLPHRSITSPPIGRQSSPSLPPRDVVAARLPSQLAPQSPPPAAAPPPVAGQPRPGRMRTPTISLEARQPPSFAGPRPLPLTPLTPFVSGSSADGMVVARPSVVVGGQPAASPPRSLHPERDAPAPSHAAARPTSENIFGTDLISEKSLDEVILAYLADDPPSK